MGATPNACVEVAMLKRQVRSVIRSISPELDGILHSRGMRKHFRRSFEERQRISKGKAFGAEQPVILRGPFAGMRYLDEIVWGPIEPKWFGAYETELHGIVERILRTGYDTIVDVGSAEGYYAVGFAYKMPNVTVKSFDIDPWARAQQRRLARLNNVTNLTLGKRCAAADLDRLRKGRSLLVCDIEGGEYDLLDPQTAPSLAFYDILVEMHASEARGLTALTGAEWLASRFGSTHRIETVGLAARSAEALKMGGELARFSPQELAQCLDEGRSMDQCWLWLQALRSEDAARSADR